MSAQDHAFPDAMIQDILHEGSFQDLTPESFLSGPERETFDVTVDPVFATSLQDIF
jgi:hypothetical protein